MKWSSLVQWRTPITLVVLVVILLGAAYYGWATVVNPTTGSDPSSTPTTSPPVQQVCVQRTTYPKGTVVRAGSFRVNVYNASSVSGRAGEVLTNLHDIGFQLGVADNPPPLVTATNVSILTSTPRSPRVELLSQQFRGKVRLVPGPHLAMGVDVVVGPAFAGLAPGAPRTLTLTQPRTVCLEWKPAPEGNA